MFKLHSLFSSLVSVFIMATLINILNPASARSKGQPLISLEVRDATLEKTLNHVSKLSGYTIELQPALNDLSVTVLLENLPLEKAVLKILDNRINYLIVWNDKEKKISIMGVEISKKNKKENGFRIQNKPLPGLNTEFRSQKIPLSGQHTRFEQISRTTHY